MYKSIDFELYCLSQIARFFSGKAPRLVAMKVYDESEEVLQYLAWSQAWRENPEEGVVLIRL